MDSALARVRHRRGFTVTRAAIIHAAEIVVGAVVLILVLEAVLRFSLFDPLFWQRYGRTFQVGLVGSLGFLLFVIPISTVIGFFAGWARVSRRRLFAWPSTLFVDFFRGIPPLILVIFAFLFGADFIPQVFADRFLSGVPLRNISIGAAATAIALHSAAYQAEIFRAGFQSVPKGQLEAAQALGLRPWQSMRFVVLPQTFRLSLPPLGNELAVLIKDTSLLAIIAGGAELVGRSQNFLGTLSVNQYPLVYVFAVWTAVAFSYFAMTFAVTRVLLALERRFHTPGLEAASI